MSFEKAYYAGVGPSTMPRRRAVLATAGSLLAAGCLAPARDVLPDDDHSPSTDGPPDSDDCTAGFDVSARTFDPAGELTMRLDDTRRALVAEAMEDGAAEGSRYSDSPPVDDGYVERDGTYYATTSAHLGSSEVPALILNLEWEDGQEAPADAEAVAFADLPSADRAALRFAVYGGPFDRERDDHPTEHLGVRDSPVPYPDGTDGSALADDGETWVRWNGRTYRVRSGERTTTRRHRFRVEVTEVAADADAFREFVADEHLLELSGLSSGEREILREATDGVYEECTPASEELAALRDRLAESDRLPRPMWDEWYVAFDGSRYALSVHRWEH